MTERKYSVPLLLSLIGSILVIINGAWVFADRAPIVFSSFEASSVEDIMDTDIFWGRIAYGIPGLVEGYSSLFWLAFSVATLLCCASIYRNPRKHHSNGLLIMIFSLLSLPIGGGFYIGAILGFIGGAVGLEWPKSFSETFFGKMARAATFNSKFYTLIRNRKGILGLAAFTVTFVSALSGIGNGLYAYNADLIRGNSTSTPEILLQGHVMWQETPVITAISLIGMGVVKWLLLSIAVYWIGVRLTGISISYEEVAAIIAFAYVPEIMQVFMPFMFSNEPTLSYIWPVGLYVISRLWVFSILVVATIRAFDFSRAKALGAAIFAGTLYWIIYHMFIVPGLNVPGIEIGFEMPESSGIILLWVTVTTVIAMFSGVFKKK